MAVKQETAGQWKSLVGAVKEKYGNITDNELTQLNGNIDQLIGLVQRKSGQTREQVEAFVHDCGEACESVVGKVSEYVSSAAGTLREGLRRCASSYGPSKTCENPFTREAPS